ncbi:hypothetical protein [Aliidiomarina minuta]|nr:hypothetical protein [Aliidiomarina minuta]
MAENQNYREESGNRHLVLGVLVFVGVALLPVLIAVIQLIAG